MEHGKHKMPNGKMMSDKDMDKNMKDKKMSSLKRRIMSMMKKEKKHAV